eukprot:gnl/Dysnectes_brevis/3390_a4264_579.p1 GENE.gnl/Dysnectes_brevis/3390_a4264_579~~gnl/Dysnectes_brevis/3390_a4264_579.p1  ORF type:complete len:444 (+),score=160.71 gnl/Dysnectes_brevis/3390_a4264_579:197-1528(+)
MLFDLWITVLCHKIKNIRVKVKIIQFSHTSTSSPAVSTRSSKDIDSASYRILEELPSPAHHHGFTLTAESVSFFDRLPVLYKPLCPDHQLHCDFSTPVTVLFEFHVPLTRIFHSPHATLTLPLGSSTVILQMAPRYHKTIVVRPVISTRRFTLGRKGFSVRVLRGGRTLGGGKDFRLDLTEHFDDDTSQSATVQLCATKKSGLVPIETRSFPLSALLPDKQGAPPLLTFRRAQILLQSEQTDIPGRGSRILHLHRPLELRLVFLRESMVKRPIVEYLVTRVPPPGIATAAWSVETEPKYVPVTQPSDALLCFGRAVDSAEAALLAAEAEWRENGSTTMPLVLVVGGPPEPLPASPLHVVWLTTAKSVVGTPAGVNEYFKLTTAGIDRLFSQSTVLKTYCKLWGEEAPFPSRPGPAVYGETRPPRLTPNPLRCEAGDPGRMIIE